MGSEMLTRTSVVSGDRLANDVTFPTNATGPGAAMSPIWRYSSLTSGAGVPAAGSTLGFGAELPPVAVVELLHAIMSAAPVRRKPEKILDIVGMSGNTLSGLCGFY